MRPVLWIAFSGSRGTRTLKRDSLAACFQDRFLIQSDDFRTSVAGAGIGPTSRRSERRILPLDDPASFVRSRTRTMHRSSRVAGVGIEPTPPGSKPSIAANSDYPAVFREGRVGLEPTRWCLTGTRSAAELPTQFKVHCGNRTRLSSLEGWHLCRSAKGTCGRRGS